MSLLIELIPMLFGYVAKLLAIKSKASTDSLNLAIMLNKSNNDVINQAREQSNKESPYAAFNRRFIFFTVLMLVVFYVTVPVFLNIQTAVPIVHEGFSFLGFQITADVIEYQMVSGLVKYDEVFAWCAMILEFYVGSQVAKG